MIQVNTPPTVELSEFDYQFIELVDNRITGYKQIPYTVPTQLIIDMIKYCAKYFYKHNWRCGQRSFWYLDKKDVERYVKKFGKDDRVSQSFSVVLPQPIRNVEDIMEVGTGIIYGDGSSDSEYNFSYGVSSPIYQQSSPYGQTLIGINQSLYAINYGIRLVEQTAMQSVFFQSVPFNFNITTKLLTIHKNLEKSFVLRCIVDIQLQRLYEDELFQEFVIAHVKRELKRVLGGHTIELPGGVTMNPDEICDNLEVIDTIKEQLKQSSGVGDILMIR